MAAELYTQQFMISNKTPYLHINTSQKGMIPLGPTDATVIDSTFVILDSFGAGVSFFDNQGKFLNRIRLPKKVRFEHIVRDRDNSLFVLGMDSEQTMIIHIKNGAITEQSIQKITKNAINNLIPDDYGLFMERNETHFDQQKFDEARRQGCEGCLDNALNEMEIYVRDSVNRYCISCEPKPTDGASVNGLIYRINNANQTLSIGKKEVPLILYAQYKTNYLEIIQVDKNGTAWVENAINLDGHKWFTYVWKVNKLGEIVAMYRFPSDMESNTTLWPMKHDIIVSNDGKVYAMTSNKQHFKFIQLNALSLKDMQHLAKDLDPVLLLKKTA